MLATDVDNRCVVDNYELLVTILAIPLSKSSVFLIRAPTSKLSHQHPKIDNNIKSLTSLCHQHHLDLFNSKIDPESYKPRRKRRTNETMALHLWLNNWCCFSHRYCNEIVLALHAKINLVAK